MSAAAPPLSSATPAALADSLYRLLCSLDPATWRDEAEHAAVDAAARVRAECAALLASWERAPAETITRVRLQNAVERIASALPESFGGIDWRDLRDRLAPLYDALAAALKEDGARAHAVRPTNYTRNLFHAMNATIVVALFHVLPDAWLVPITGAAAAAAWSMEISRRFSPKINTFLMWIFKHVAHAHEAHEVNSSTWYTTALFVLALTAPNAAGMLGVLALGYGDPIAALIGRRFGRHRLWRNRSLEGTGAFAITAFVVGAVYLVIASPLGLGGALVLAGIAAVVGAIVELFSIRLDDNVTIPVATAWASLGALALLS